MSLVKGKSVEPTLALQFVVFGRLSTVAQWNKESLGLTSVVNPPREQAGAVTGKTLFGKFGDLRPGAGRNLGSAAGNLCAVESFDTQPIGERRPDRKRA